MDPSTPPPQKKGLGVLAWLGIGCGGLIVLVVILVFVVGMRLGPALKQFGTDFQKNPTKATASMMISASAGQFEMVAEDDVNKRYTLRQKSNGKLTTIYWDEKKKAPVTIPGDFSAIPADANPPATPEGAAAKP
ncbi:MAG TPA: hypothetical protein VGM54_18170 [Chthoniobacter sp.]|jgi:hypothetical protein